MEPISLASLLRDLYFGSMVPVISRISADNPRWTQASAAMEPNTEEAFCCLIGFLGSMISVMPPTLFASNMEKRINLLTEANDNELVYLRELEDRSMFTLDENVLGQLPMMNAEEFVNTKVADLLVVYKLINAFVSIMAEVVAGSEDPKENGRAVAEVVLEGWDDKAAENSK